MRYSFFIAKHVFQMYFKLLSQKTGITKTEVLTKNENIPATLLQELFQKLTIIYTVYLHGYRLLATLLGH